MSSLVRRVLCLVALLPAVAPGAAAQRLTAPSFVFARYASGSASALYAARGFGRAGGFVAMVQNPTTQYRELIAGGYTQVNWGGQSVLVAVAYADASDGRYVQTYLNPALSGGPLSFSATVEWYEPLEPAATRQLSVNPASLLARVARRFGVGVAYTLDLAPGSAAQRRVGAAAEWTAKWGTLRLEVLDRTVGESTEARVGVVAAF